MGWLTRARTAGPYDYCIVVDTSNPRGAREGPRPRQASSVSRQSSASAEDSALERALLGEAAGADAYGDDARARSSSSSGAADSAGDAEDSPAGAGGDTSLGESDSTGDGGANLSALSLVVDALSRVGLDVDVVHTRVRRAKGRAGARVGLVLVHAPLALCTKYRVLSWLKHGAVRDFRPFAGLASTEPERWERAFMRHFGAAEPAPITSAERTEIVDRIIRKDARVDSNLPFVLRAFPLHDGSVSRLNARSYVTATHLLSAWRKQGPLLDAMNATFGQRVAYYFAFSDFYNSALFPLSVLGSSMHVMWKLWPQTYMRVLPLWGAFVSTVWPFVLLKWWERRESELQFRWGDMISKTGVRYPNQDYRGKMRRNAATGERQPANQRYRRVPKLLCVGLFYLLLALIILVFNGLFITLYNTQAVFQPMILGLVLGLIVNFPLDYLIRATGQRFTRWLNYPTEDDVHASRNSLRFSFDLMLYVSWYMLVAVIYATPTAGDGLTNLLNFIFFADPPNCCFGAYVCKDDPDTCCSCPSSIFNPTAPSTLCVPCKGFFTFSASVDVSTAFIAPVAIVQSLNLFIACVYPFWLRRKDARRRAKLAQHTGATLVAAPPSTVSGFRSDSRASSRASQGDAPGSPGSPVYVAPPAATHTTRIPTGGPSTRGFHRAGGAASPVPEEAAAEAGDAPFVPSPKHAAKARLLSQGHPSSSSLAELGGLTAAGSTGSLAELHERPPSTAAGVAMDIRAVASPGTTTTGYVMTDQGPRDNATGKPLRASDVLAEGKMPFWDQDDGYRDVALMFAFVATFSSIFPLWPALCLMLNLVRVRADTFRVCYASQRPYPRKAAGIGAWQRMMRVAAYLAVLLNVGVVFFTTSALDQFFSGPDCNHDPDDLAKTFFTPSFQCVPVVTRLWLAIAVEHVALAVSFTITRSISSVPSRVRIGAERVEWKFKLILEELLGEGGAHSDAQGTASPRAAEAGGVRQRIGRNGSGGAATPPHSTSRGKRREFVHAHDV